MIHGPKKNEVSTNLIYKFFNLKPVQWNFKLDYFTISVITFIKRKILYSYTNVVNSIRLLSPIQDFTFHSLRNYF